MTVAPPRTAAPGVPTSRAARIVVWTLQLLGAAAFLAAGGAKLAGVPMMVESFDQIGFGQEFRIVTGLVEIAGGLLLITPRLAALGGLLLAVTMVFATATHLFIIGGSPAGAIVLLLVTATLAWMRRGQVRALLNRR